VAHRLSTIKNADEVVFMENGKILGIDTFERLSKQIPRFKRMVEFQEL
jgi:ABC-type multidrug transport system fused ATPase/permease subunit